MLGIERAITFGGFVSQSPAVLHENVRHTLAVPVARVGENGSPLICRQLIPSGIVGLGGTSDQKRHTPQREPRLLFNFARFSRADASGLGMASDQNRDTPPRSFLQFSAD